MQREKEELEAKLEATRGHIHDREVRFKTLRHERNALLTRIRTAKSEQAASHGPEELRRQQRRHQDKSTSAVATHSHQHATSHMHVGDDVMGARRGVASRSIVPTRIGRQKFTDDYDEVPCPIASFRDHVPISFADIAPFMPPSELWYRDHHNAVSAAITAYLQSVGAERGRATCEICWFNQLPYTLPGGLQLSHSSGALSPECCLSLSLAFPAFSAEALFLVLEYEAVEAATNPAYAPPPHPELDAMHDEHALLLDGAKFDVAPERPRERDLASCKVLC